MKKQLTIAFLLLIGYTSTSQTQTKTETETNDHNVAFIVRGKLGFAKYNETGNIPLNGFVNGSDFLFSFKVGKKTYIETGFGFLEFDGNPTISGNSVSIKNSYLHFPVQLNGDFNLFDSKDENPNILLNIGVGLYANTLLKSEVETVLGNDSAKNLGWNFGISTQVGAKFIVSKAVNIGLGLESQSDFNKMKKDGVERKIEHMNAFYFSLTLKN